MGKAALTGCLIGVVGCLAGFCLAFNNPVVSKETETSSKVKDLQKKRLAVLQSIYDLTKKGGRKEEGDTHDPTRRKETPMIRRSKLDNL